MCHPGLARLVDREVELLQLAGVHEFPEKEPRVVDVSQGADRTRTVAGCSSAVTPGSRLYFTHRCRLQVPLESFYLQGIAYDQRVLSKFPSSTLQDLAGNAFETSCCLASIVVACLMLSCGASARTVGAPAYALMAPGVGSDTPESGSDSDLDF